MRHLTPTCRLICAAMILAAPLSSTADDSAVRNDAPRFAAADSPGVIAFRGKQHIDLMFTDALPAGRLTIPRIMAPLDNIRWLGSVEVQTPIRCTPEQTEWVLEWEHVHEAAKGIRIELAAAPKLPGEENPIRVRYDGSYKIPAHMGKTEGNKVRYEPQTYKNCVGYWTGANDSATWTLDVEAAGRFNVAILQGCGKGQGGSQATISISNEQSERPLATLAFETKDTGHFQNFQWRHLGEIEIPVTGRVELTIKPEKIEKVALMDVRTIELVRLPAKK